MSWQTMATELVGQVGVINIQFALTLINRAYQDIQRNYEWSFLQGLDVAIPTFSPLSTGTVTLTRGVNTVVSDAAARTAWANIGLVTPITTLQFRIGSGTIYNIIKYQDNVPPGFATITLDRLYVDPPAGAAQGYSIFQCYFNAPFQDFVWWDSFLDPVTGYPFDLYRTRAEIDREDPQRLVNNTPLCVIPYTVNQQAGNFFGFPMYEIWPAPAGGLTYVGKCWRDGSPLVNFTDTVAPALGEDLVLERAKKYAYEWCEANKDKLLGAQKNADFRFLMGKAEKEYQRLENRYIFKDGAYSRFHFSPSSQRRRNLVLPWVSQKVGLASFPG